MYASASLLFALAIAGAIDRSGIIHEISARSNRSVRAAVSSARYAVQRIMRIFSSSPRLTHGAVSSSYELDKLSSQCAQGQHRHRYYSQSTEVQELRLVIWPQRVF